MYFNQRDNSRTELLRRKRSPSIRLIDHEKRILIVVHRRRTIALYKYMEEFDIAEPVPVTGFSAQEEEFVFRSKDHAQASSGTFLRKQRTSGLHGHFQRKKNEQQRHPDRNLLKKKTRQSNYHASV
ncbi:hypothetical protein CEXT_815721 [Caerostris extrusa]|uniref:Uncharacterized protein n=1 Tax=Caerostris extrusa TaxID=172846 RepID=A0AAV4UCE9_CAEEX|nr:hypothetical protein CEXT_815721 [Caerostris extrusa]